MSNNEWLQAALELIEASSEPHSNQAEFREEIPMKKVIWSDKLSTQDGNYKYRVVAAVSTSGKIMLFVERQNGVDAMDNEVWVSAVGNPRAAILERMATEYARLALSNSTKEEKPGMRRELDETVTAKAPAPPEPPPPPAEAPPPARRQQHRPRGASNFDPFTTLIGGVSEPVEDDIEGYIQGANDEEDMDDYTTRTP